jgi:hypothetical protein
MDFSVAASPVTWNQRLASRIAQQYGAEETLTSGVIQLTHARDPFRVIPLMNKKSILNLLEVQVSFNEEGSFAVRRLLYPSRCLGREGEGEGKGESQTDVKELALLKELGKVARLLHKHVVLQLPIVPCPAGFQLLSNASGLYSLTSFPSARSNRLVLEKTKSNSSAYSWSVPSRGIS